MSLIYCEECGNQISDQAFACPKCGKPTNVQKTSGKAKTSKNFFEVIEDVVSKVKTSLKPVDELVNKIPELVTTLLFPALAVLLFISILIPCCFISVTFLGSTTSTSGSIINMWNGVFMLIILILDLALYILTRLGVIPKILDKLRVAPALLLFIFMLISAIRTGSAISDANALASIFGTSAAHIGPGLVIGWISVLLIVAESLMNIFTKESSFNLKIKVEKVEK